jgi:hypothetical protein
MPRGLRVWLAAIAIVIVISPLPALAGDPWAPNPQCERVSISPPVYRLSMMLYNTHLFDPLCAVRVSPAPYDTPTGPVLACSAPPPFVASLDTTAGVALFTLSPCDTTWGSQGPFTMDVAAVPTWLRCDLFTGPFPRQTNDVYFTCGIVPTSRRSWGALKLHYR